MPREMNDKRDGRRGDATRRGFMTAAGLGLLGAAFAGKALALTRRPRMMLVYVGTYTSGGSAGVYLYLFNLADGSLRRVGVGKGIVNPSYLTLAPDRRFLYAVEEVEEFEGAKSGAVSAFEVDQQTGGLRWLNRRASRGGAPCYVTAAGSGRFVLVANYMGGNVAVLPAAADGTLGE